MIRLVLTVALAALLLPSQGRAQPRFEFSAEEMALARAVSSNPDLADFYGGNDLVRVFDGDEGASRRRNLQKAIALMPQHGLPAARYRADALAGAGQGLEGEVLFAQTLARLLRDVSGGMIWPGSAISQIKRPPPDVPVADLMRDFLGASDMDAFLAGLGPRTPAYRALQRELREGTSLTVTADLPPVPEGLWRIGARAQGIGVLRQRLASLGFDPGEGPAQSYDRALSQAVAQYQRAAGLAPDGVAGPNTIRRLNSRDDPRRRAVLVALERMRWLSAIDPDPRQIWVNIPQFSAWMTENGHEIFRTPVIVGETEDSLQTPEFSDQMEYLVVNPSWNVPRSITVREYLPKLRANRYAVAHLDVVDAKGRVIARDRIDFARYSARSFPYRLRQKPGTGNALGIVKFIFPNPWNIYLHDTPGKHLFDRASRAFSHGCVRVGDPVDLAAMLLAPQSADPQAMFQRALDSGRERWLTLTPNVPVHLVYFTAFPDQGGTVRYFDDIYGRDADIWALLERAGLDLDRDTD